MDLTDGWRANRTRLARGENAAEYIPTWQVGIEQYQQESFRKFATDGFETNSLIYICMRQRATSFAPLKVQVVRKGGIIAANHRMTRLLSDPNCKQDSVDFQDELMTHFDASGNAYIQKVRVSADRDRRAKFATYPVQELRLIRPDYVTIEPGANADQDVFLVRIAGVERARIPRADMIQIKEPSLTNDFYGHSKIAVLAREGALDLHMSDFDIAFFKNAGVPMGLLSVKGRVTEEETKAIQFKFSNAFNGVRKWFRLLVLNSDNATYTPMGMKQSEMEMEGTRFHVETRICGVFEVPPLIAGARVAIQNPGMTYEDAEHAFWAEAMVPAATRFAGAWKKLLLPEFATGADADADVTYDFTAVRALQEDRSRKLREVVRLVLTGGFTVNQALMLVGLPTNADGDFFVRNANQVVVSATGEITPMTEPGTSSPNVDNPLEGAARLAIREAERLVEAG